jgi:hypothetical protein
MGKRLFGQYLAVIVGADVFADSEQSQAPPLDDTGPAGCLGRDGVAMQDICHNTSRTPWTVDLAVNRSVVNYRDLGLNHGFPRAAIGRGTLIGGAFYWLGSEHLGPCCQDD